MNGTILLFLLRLVWFQFLWVVFFQPFPRLMNQFKHPIEILYGECIHSFLSPHLACYLAYYLAILLLSCLLSYFLLKINQPGCNSHFNYGYDFKYNKPEFDKHLSKDITYTTRITLIPQCREYFKLFKTQRKIDDWYYRNHHFPICTVFTWRKNIHFGCCPCLLKEIFQRLSVVFFKHPLHALSVSFRLLQTDKSNWLILIVCGIKGLVGTFCIYCSRALECQTTLAVPPISKRQFVAFVASIFWQSSSLFFINLIQITAYLFSTLTKFDFDNCCGFFKSR